MMSFLRGSLKVLAIYCAVLLVSENVKANVSLKNGNFFVAYTDVIYTGGFETKLERVYNSKSSFKGMFGWGWGNEFEARLNVSGDGSVVVHEYGGGAENRFSPVKGKASDLDSAVESLVKVAQSQGTLGSSGQISEYRTRLKGDASFRNQQWEIFRSLGKIQARQLAPGTQLQSNRFSYQYITKVADGYFRTLADSGKTEKFDAQGHLVKVSDKNGNSVSFEYGSDGHLKKLMDNTNRKMFFEYNNRGLVSKIDAEGGRSATYSYNSEDELVRSQDVDGNTYSFKYDSNRRHNLIEIEYSDRSKLSIAYHGLDRQENVERVVDRDGVVTEYDYGSNVSNRGSSSVTVTSKKGSELISKNKYQYFTKQKAGGEEWTYKLISDVDGDQTETTYNECCGLPVLIKQGGQETRFEYDIKGHITKKTTPYQVTELHYDPVINKVDRVNKYSIKNRKKAIWSQFEYDSKGNLIIAKSSDGRGVRLVYDNLGRIKSMMDQSKELINFKYNELSKPIEISDPALGTISVSYSNSGELKEVRSQGGPKVAAQVTASFQSLLDIVKPAGVTLAF